MSAGTRIKIDHVRKEYANFTAIEDLSLDIHPGEFFTLLGPSGCGKTTLLRMIAGFNSIESGSIAFDGTPVHTKPPKDRNIGMVFQDYALFPHMSAGKNVGFGLEAKRVDRAARDRLVSDALDMVHMSSYGDRRPSQMSGGQQQRIAMARAMAVSPAVLLMDEPLSNLDAKLRVSMRETIRSLQTKSGITTVYVTHDQEEAMAVSDRIAVMNGGEIEQVGTPDEIYMRPASPFVADFIGKSNWLDGEVAQRDGRFVVVLPDSSLFPLQEHTDAPSLRAGRPVRLSVRPEAVAITHMGGADGTVLSRAFLGPIRTYQVELASGNRLDLVQVTSGETSLEVGSRVNVRINAEGVNVFDAADGLNLLREISNADLT